MIKAEVKVGSIRGCQLIVMAEENDEQRPSQVTFKDFKLNAKV